MAVIVYVGLMLWGMASVVGAVDITFTWDPNSEENLAGYRIYYGEGSGQYGGHVNVEGEMQRAENPVLLRGEEVTDYGWQNTGRTTAPEVTEDGTLILKGQNWVKVELKQYAMVHYGEPVGEDFVWKGKEYMEVGLGYHVRKTSILEFDFMSTEEGGAHAIGFDNDNTSYNSAVTEGWAIKLFGTVGGWKTNAVEQYKVEDGWKHYSIQLSYLENVLCPTAEPCPDPFPYITFIMDNRKEELRGVGNCYFKNIALTHMGYVVDNFGTVTGLTPDNTYYFAATAYDDEGMESDFSNEVVAKTTDPILVLSPLEPGKGRLRNETFDLWSDGISVH